MAFGHENVLEGGIVMKMGRRADGLDRFNREKENNIDLSRCFMSSQFRNEWLDELKF